MSSSGGNSSMASSSERVIPYRSSCGTNGSVALEQKIENVPEPRSPVPRRAQRASRS